jgi:uncharacterized repeat protein (TIGR01451 family)
VSKTAAPTTVLDGEKVTYTIRFYAATNVYIQQIRDTLPAGWDWDDLPPTKTGVANNDCTITTTSQNFLTNVLTINFNQTDLTDAGDVCEIQLGVYANGTGVDRVNPSIQVRHAPTSNGGNVNQTTATNLAPVTVNSSFQVTKSGSPNPTAGSPLVTYSVAIQNLIGTQFDLASTNTFQDFLPVGFYYVTGTAQLNGAPIPDPVTTAGGASRQILTWNLAGRFLPANATVTLSYQAAAGAGTGSSSNVITVQGSYAGGATITKGDDLTVAVNIANRLWGQTAVAYVDPPETGPTLPTPAGAQDLTLNDVSASSTSDNWAAEGPTTTDSFVWTAVQDRATAGNPTQAIAVIRFSVDGGYVDDRFEWQLCVDNGVAPTCNQNEDPTAYVDWRKIRSFGVGEDQMPPTGAPSAGLRTIAVDVSGLITTDALADNLQFRVVGKGSNGAETCGAENGDCLQIHFDEVVLLTN